MKSIKNTVLMGMLAASSLAAGCAGETGQIPAFDSESGGAIERSASGGTMSVRQSFDDQRTNVLGGQPMIRVSDAMKTDALGGRPAPDEPDCDSSAAGDVCPEGTRRVDVAQCDELPPGFGLCHEVEFETPCDDLEIAVCLGPVMNPPAPEPDPAPAPAPVPSPEPAPTDFEVCDGMDNDNDGAVDEDTECEPLVREETCASGDEDNDGRIDEGLECDPVARAEAYLPCGMTGSPDIPSIREAVLCPEGYYRTETPCDELASSALPGEGCVTVEAVLCGREVSVECAMTTVHYTEEGGFQGGARQFRCVEAAFEVIDAEAICAEIGLEDGHDTCIIDQGPGIPTETDARCLAVNLCIGEANTTNITCRLPTP